MPAPICQQRRRAAEAGFANRRTRASARCRLDLGRVETQGLLEGLGGLLVLALLSVDLPQ